MPQCNRWYVFRYLGSIFFFFFLWGGRTSGTSKSDQSPPWCEGYTDGCEVSESDMEQAEDGAGWGLLGAGPGEDT